MKQPGGARRTRRGSVAIRWPASWPGPVQRMALVGGVLGSFLGLVLGLLSVNRPLLNGLLFYVLGFPIGIAVGALGGLLLACARELRRPPAGR